MGVIAALIGPCFDRTSQDVWPITTTQGAGFSEQVVSSVEQSVAFGRFCLVRIWQDAAVDLDRTRACLRRHFA